MKKISGTFIKFAESATSELYLDIDKLNSNENVVVKTYDDISTNSISNIYTNMSDSKIVEPALKDIVSNLGTDLWVDVFVENGKLPYDVYEQIKDKLVFTLEVDTPPDESAEVDDFTEIKSVEARIAATKAYTKPELRERIKDRIMAGSRGGKPGQWSARKAQLLALEYRRAGGKYKGRKKKGQRSLDKWTREEWTTSDGKPAIRESGTTRYLPKKAWSKLSPAERRATNRKKREASTRGIQFVANTRKARRAGRSARRVKTYALEKRVQFPFKATPEQAALLIKSLTRPELVFIPSLDDDLGFKTIRKPRDGDGDGFTTNPVTRQDNMPVIPDMPDEDEGAQALRELKESLGIYDSPRREQRGRNAWMFDRPQPREPEAEEMESDDPIKAPRRRARIEGVSAADWIGLESMVADIAPLIEKNNLQHRERGRLARLQRALRNTKFSGSQGGLDLEVNPELVKRFVKGLEVLDGIGQLDDKLKNLLASLKRLQRYDAIQQLPEAGTKSLESSGIEVKILGRRAGRRATRGVRRMFEEVAFDGDNDGFITNPFTGKDEIPWNKAEETREEAIERFFRDPKNRAGGRRFRRIGDMIGGITKRNVAKASNDRVRQRSKLQDEGRKMFSLPAQGSSDPTGMSASERLQNLITNMNASSIKDRNNAEEVLLAVGAVSAAVRDDFGDLKSVNDYVNAFASKGIKAKIKPPPNFGHADELSIAERSALDHILYFVGENVTDPDKLRLKIAFNDGNGQAFTQPYLPTSLGMVNEFTDMLDKRKMKIVLPLPNSAGTEQGVLMDTVISQSMKSVLAQSIADGDSPEITMQKVDVVRQSLTSVHELGHFFNIMKGFDDYFNNKTAQQVEDEVADRIYNQYDETIEGFTAIIGSLQVMKAMQADAVAAQIMAELRQLEEVRTIFAASGQSTESIDSAIADGRQLLDRAMDSLVDYVADISKHPELAQRVFMLRQDSDGNTVFAGIRPDAQEEIAKAAFDGFERVLLADLGKSVTEKEMGLDLSTPDWYDQYKDYFSTSMIPPSDMLDGNQLVIESPEYRAAELARRFKMTALHQLVSQKEQGNLTEEEWDQFRSILKYISSYAKDKHSWYNGQASGGIPLSVEGIAEAFTATFLGLPIDPKNKVGGQQIFGKLLQWMNVMAVGPTPIASSDFSVDDIIGDGSE